MAADVSEGKKPTAELAGEFFRESGVLTLVFGLMDELHQKEPARAGWLAGVLVTGVLLVAMGMLVERRR